MDVEIGRFESCDLVSRTVRVEITDGIYSWYYMVNDNRGKHIVRNTPFREGVKGFVSSFCDDRNLIASNCVDKPPALYDGFGPN